jgi:hypothetical protein
VGIEVEMNSAEEMSEEEGVEEDGGEGGVEEEEGEEEVGEEEASVKVEVEREAEMGTEREEKAWAGVVEEGLAERARTDEVGSVGCDEGGREAITLEVWDSVRGLLGGRRVEEEVVVLTGNGVEETGAEEAVRTPGVCVTASECRTISTGLEMSRALGPLMYRSEGLSVGGTVSWVR